VSLEAFEGRAVLTDDLSGVGSSQRQVGGLPGPRAHPLIDEGWGGP